jgi:RimJ/RimL family protein N-acetyltransferase
VLLAIHRDNAASQRVAERAGFADTGRRRPSRHSTDGDADHAVYAWTGEAQQ